MTPSKGRKAGPTAFGSAAAATRSKPRAASTASRSRSRKQPAAPATPPPRSLLRPLGIVGYDGVEPALLAALATGDPLLLVSEHGAAKTLLLVRLAEALGLELRHYNASLLQFDDLVGFPIPDDRGGILGGVGAGPGELGDPGRAGALRGGWKVGGRRGGGG